MFFFPSMAIPTIPSLPRIVNKRIVDPVKAYLDAVYQYSNVFPYRSREDVETAFYTFYETLQAEGIVDKVKGLYLFFTGERESSTINFVTRNYGEIFNGETAEATPGSLQLYGLSYFRPESFTSIGMTNRNDYHIYCNGVDNANNSFQHGYELENADQSLRIAYSSEATSIILTTDGLNTEYVEDVSGYPLMVGLRSNGDLVLDYYTSGFSTSNAYTTSASGPFSNPYFYYGNLIQVVGGVEYPNSEIASPYYGQWLSMGLYLNDTEANSLYNALDSLYNSITAV
jgi:hypothetical protein